jgi:CBS domain-containing protein
MQVKQAMHTGAQWVEPSTPLTTLARLMQEHNIGAIPIGGNDRLVGMVTDRDLCAAGWPPAWTSTAQQHGM